MKKLCLIMTFVPFFHLVYAQDLTAIIQTGDASINSVMIDHSARVALTESHPFFSYMLNGKDYPEPESVSLTEEGKWSVRLSKHLSGELQESDFAGKGIKYVLSLKNNGRDTIFLENIVPFGADGKSVYITATGPWELARAKLFRPGYGPVRVILPDNAWEMGYGSAHLENGATLCGISRRTGYEGSVRARYQTLIPPGGNVEYTFWLDAFTGSWQEGLRLMFQERWLYDLENFDNSLYNRDDLGWIRHAYVIFLEFAWDQAFYSRDNGIYHVDEQISHGKELFGGYDVIGIWPTWPRLGLDERNLFDLYRDMPGGLMQLRSVSEYIRNHNARFFISYNQWDESTRQENHFEALTRLIRAVEADGVVLDATGKSSPDLQESADKARPGVIMYSEGMAIPLDMPRIVAGRVHDAIQYQPELNLNKMIKPEFGIFRVCHIKDGRLHREVAISFFNGIGTEIINFAPGRPAWIDEELAYLGRTTMILRENSTVFNNPDWVPLVETATDSIWVNRWTDGQKDIYTIYSLIPEGYAGPLFPAEKRTGYHFVSLWNHEEIELVESGGLTYIPVSIESFNKADLGTRNEGSNECVAMFPLMMSASRKGDSVSIQSDQGYAIKVWKGDPGYQADFYTIPSGNQSICFRDSFGNYQDKIVLQLFDRDELKDECILKWIPGKPWLISVSRPAGMYSKVPDGMVFIPGGTFRFNPDVPDQFIPYPDYPGNEVRINSFCIDKFPVTNSDYFRFVTESGYMPGDTSNYLRHWHNGKYSRGTDNLPVVYISYEDALAYASWAGKRLPTEKEWQFAAQGTDGRTWPWGDKFRKDLCNDGKKGLMPVRTWPKGCNQFGVCDLTGNAWQITNDLYSNGSHRFVIIRGGSCFNPASSEWYLKGGPRPLDNTQMLLMVSPGFDRCSTVGFRCVADIALKPDL
jgi:formylglycine-generating enzyme required for sulfatase activity